MQSNASGTSKIENRIRDWLMTFPGLVVFYSPQAVLKEAMAMFTAASGAKVDLPVMTDSLWRAGYRPEQVGVHWQLALPEKPTGGADWNRIARMNNITR